MENKRYEYRTPIHIIVDRLQVPETPHETERGHIFELSASGCRIETEVELEPDQLVRVSFVLPGGNVILNAAVRVVRILSRDKNRRTVAGRFENLSETDQYKIREFIVWKEAQEGRS